MSDYKFHELPYIVALVKSRYAVLIHFCLICCVAWVYAFLIAKKEFKSEIVFLPPSDESPIASLLPGEMNLSSIFSNAIMPEQIQTIFASKSMKREIINTFNLIGHYKLAKNPNKVENAIKALNKALFLSSEEAYSGAMGLSKTISFSLTAYHTSADTAKQIADYSFVLLDSAVKAINADRAHRNRIFLEQQLCKCRQNLDSAQQNFQLFQNKNKAFNVPDQVSMSIKMYANLKVAELGNEIKIQALKNEYSSNTPEIVALQKENTAYREKLAQLESQSTPDVMLSLKMSTELLPTYTNLVREIEIQSQLMVLLGNELENAKIKEVKNISGLIVTDPAMKAEYKSRPKRIIIIGTIVSLYMFFIVLMIVYAQFIKIHVMNSPYLKSILLELNSKTRK
jgi:capsule polysaccharide export protein KpsE/RkpR